MTGDVSHADILAAIGELRGESRARDKARSDQHDENIERFERIYVKLDKAFEQIAVLELARASLEGKGIAAKIIISVGWTVGVAVLGGLAWALSLFGGK